MFDILRAYESLLIAWEYQSNRDAYYFKYCILDHLLKLACVAFTTSNLLASPHYFHRLEDDREASSNFSRPKNRHLLLGPGQARTIKGLTPPTSLIVVLLRFRFSGIWGCDKASVDANAFSISLVSISYNQ